MERKNILNWADKNKNLMYWRDKPNEPIKKKPFHLTSFGPFSPQQDFTTWLLYHFLSILIWLNVPFKVAKKTTRQTY
jgi:hypothetical protein